MLNKLKFAFLSIFLILPLVNCGGNYKSVYQGKDVQNIKDTSNIVVGQTTKEDIMVLFGAPTKISADKRTYHYVWPHGTPKIMITELGKTTVMAHLLDVVFDDLGLVKNYKVSNKLHA